MLAVVAAACSGDDAHDRPDDGGADIASESREDASEDAEGVDVPDDVPGEGVRSPEVTGPITGGERGLPFNPMPSRLADEHGYVEEEFFVSGEATAYEAEGSWELDGRWRAVEGQTQPYTSRILVRRPADAADFNGTVLVEWLNVTSGMDADPDFGFAHELLMRDGWAYVGVSAQVGGVEGGGGLELDIPGFDPQPLKAWDPARYRELDHPGDAYSYDIFSQAAQAVRRSTAVDPLDGLEPTTVLAIGESQAAMRLTTYVNAVHPLAGIYDGFLIHSRGANGAPLVDAPDANPVPEIAHIRTDLDEPVLQFETETDLFVLGFHDARQDDTETVRTWEVAGTAHADQSTLDYGLESGREWDRTSELDFSQACGRLNAGPQGPVLRAAVSALRAWVVDGTPPAPAEPISVIDGATIARDEHGNAEGGIRTPAVDVPVATLTGEQPEDTEFFCLLFGQTIPFDGETLGGLYTSPDDYVDQVAVAANDAVDAGFLLEPDASAIVEQARDVDLTG